MGSWALGLAAPLLSQSSCTTNCYYSLPPSCMHLANSTVASTSASPDTLLLGSPQMLNYAGTTRLPSMTYSIQDASSMGMDKKRKERFITSTLQLGDISTFIQDAMSGQHRNRNCPDFQELTAKSLPYLPDSLPPFWPHSGTVGSDRETNKANIFPTPRHAGTREAKTALT